MEKYPDSMGVDEFDADDAADTNTRFFEVPATDEWVCSEEEVRFVCDSVRDALDE